MTTDQSPAEIERADGLARREAIYNFIVHYKAAHDGNSPGVRQIARACGLKSISGVSFYLHRLAKLGRIEIDPDTPRSIRVVGARWVKPDEDEAEQKNTQQETL